MATAEASTSVLPPGELASLRDVATRVAPVPPTMPSGAVYERLCADVELLSVPVAERGKPVGLVHRHELMMSLAHRYGNALYAGKPISELMDPRPLIVEHTLKVDELEWIIANKKSSALLRGFIVTEGGDYIGVCDALSLLRLGMARTARRNRELEDTQSRAEAANHAKSHFLAVTSHELRSPLNAILGFSDLMRSEIFGPISPPRYGEYIDDIHAAAQQLLIVINDILDMSKIEQGRMELHLAPVEFVAVARSVMRLLADRARASQLAMLLDAPPDGAVVRADERALRQILLNLLTNAIKFTPPEGRVSIHIRHMPDGGVEIAVADTGIGMSSEHIEIALAPFRQVENIYSRTKEGTGLGLPLVKSLAELHGADFAIDSELGAGTTIRLRFHP